MSLNHRKARSSSGLDKFLQLGYYIVRTHTAYLSSPWITCRLKKFVSLLKRQNIRISSALYVFTKNSTSYSHHTFYFGKRAFSLFAFSFFERLLGFSFLLQKKGKYRITEVLLYDLLL